MDTAVALVQTYLHLNGYFTVTEFPVLQASRAGGRSVTDLDILAVRFRHAGHDIVRGTGHQPLGNRPFEPDPVLGCSADGPDMIVGEVKEGAAHFNPATLDPTVLEVALARFGCCELEHAAFVARAVLERGHARTPAGHTVRMVAFGDAAAPHRERQWRTIPMRHVIAFVRTYLRDHWDVLHHAQFKDSTLGTLALLEKWDRPLVPATSTSEP